MTTHVARIDTDRDIDPNASPAESFDTNTTPNTEFSMPDSPFQQAGPPKDKRLLARQKLSTLTLEEKVYPYTLFGNGNETLTSNRFPY